MRGGGFGATASSGAYTGAAGKKKRMAVTLVLCLASLFMVRDAVRAGVDVARVSISPVAKDLAAERLVLWGDVEGPEIAPWALCPSRRLLSARVSTFLEFLTESFFTDSPDGLAGFIDRVGLFAACGVRGPSSR